MAKKRHGSIVIGKCPDGCILVWPGEPEVGYCCGTHNNSIINERVPGGRWQLQKFLEKDEKMVRVHGRKAADLHAVNQMERAVTSLRPWNSPDEGQRARLKGAEIPKTYYPAWLDEVEN